VSARTLFLTLVQVAFFVALSWWTSHEELIEPIASIVQIAVGLGAGWYGMRLITQFEREIAARAATKASIAAWEEAAEMMRQSMGGAS
jgi:hypothetical protein